MSKIQIGKSDSMKAKLTHQPGATGPGGLWLCIDAGIARELHERKAIESPHIPAGVVVRVHALCAAILGLVEGH